MTERLKKGKINKKDKINMKKSKKYHYYLSKKQKMYTQNNITNGPEIVALCLGKILFLIDLKMYVR